MELPHEIKSAARWRRHAARRWDEARAGDLANATMAADVADWFFDTFTTALARPNARAADYASALWLNERGWRCGGCPAALAAGHVLELSVDEAAEVCASGVAKCEWQLAAARAGQESEIPNFKASYLGRFPLASADFWTSDHLSERSRSVDAFFGTRARGTLTLKRR